jgi:hypothetical protein
MRHLFCVFAVLILTGFCVTDSFACSCVNDLLSRRFKKAEAVFVGGVYDYEDEDIPKIQNYKEGLPVLLVKKSWKGIKKELVSVDFNLPKKPGACPELYSFDEDADYIVFAYGKELKVEVQCSDTQKLKPEYDETIKEILKLDSFWFRTWTRLNLF